MIPHRLDPAIQVAAAHTLGCLAAKGHVDARTAAIELARAAVRAGYQGDRRGLRTRMMWGVTDSAAAWEGAWLHAHYAAKRALEQRQPAAVVLAEAERANAVRGAPLSPAEVRDAAEQAAAIMLRRWRRERAYA